MPRPGHGWHPSGSRCRRNPRRTPSRARDRDRADESAGTIGHAAAAGHCLIRSIRDGHLNAAWPRGAFAEPRTTRALRHCRGRFRRLFGEPGLSSCWPPCSALSLLDLFMTKPHDAPAPRLGNAFLIQRFLFFSRIRYFRRFRVAPHGHLPLQHNRLKDCISARGDE